MSKDKPREYWLETGADLSDGTELYKRYSSTEEFNPSVMADEVVHLIEKSAYDKLRETLEWGRLYFTGLDAPSSICSMTQLKFYKNEFKEGLDKLIKAESLSSPREVGDKQKGQE